MQKNYTQSTMQNFEIVPSAFILNRVKELAKLAKTHSIHSCIELVNGDYQKELGLIINDVGVTVFLEVSSLNYRVIVESYDSSCKIQTDWITIYKSASKKHSMSATLMHQVV